MVSQAPIEGFRDFAMLNLLISPKGWILRSATSPVEDAARGEEGKPRQSI